jgi:ribosomal protein S26
LNNFLNIPEDKIIKKNQINNQINKTDLNELEGSIIIEKINMNNIINNTNSVNLEGSIIINKYNLHELNGYIIVEKKYNLNNEKIETKINNNLSNDLNDIENIPVFIFSGNPKEGLKINNKNIQKNKSILNNLSKSEINYRIAECEKLINSVNLDLEILQSINNNKFNNIYNELINKKEFYMEKQKILKNMRGDK